MPARMSYLANVTAWALDIFPVETGQPTDSSSAGYYTIRALLFWYRTLKARELPPAASLERSPSPAYPVLCHAFVIANGSPASVPTSVRYWAFPVGWRLQTLRDPVIG